MHVRNILLLLPCLLRAQPETALLQQGVTLSLHHHYPQALALFSAVADSFPDHPAAFFFQAALYQSMMLDLETNQWQSLFYRHIDQTITLAKKKPEDRWYRFYLGAALSYKSYQLARQKKYVSALSHILGSIKELNRLLKEDSSFCDPLLGVGNYLYWRSKLVAWLPLVADKKEEGRKYIHQAYECSLFSRGAALSSLCWIAIEEKAYGRAVELGRQGLAEYPHSRFFLWPLAEALFRQHDYEAARQVYQEILISLTEVQPNNHYNEIVLLWKLAQCEHHLGHAVASQNLARRVLLVQPDEEVRDRAKDEKEGALRLLQEMEREKH